jgi:hypothetical protein
VANAPRVTATLEDVRIIFRNFSGAPTRFNLAGGKRTFSVVLPEDVAKQMETEGWNVKWPPPPADDREPLLPRLEVQVKYSERAKPPRITMITSRGRTPLDENTVGLLDWAEFDQIDMIIRQYNWDINGKQGVSAYLQTLFATIHEDELELKYADIGDSGESAQISIQMSDDERGAPF